ncbi:IS3 family transposase [Listeria ivanovii]|uniref:IS3 family transposase n=1 Tax=Listeria ivanovii TaxID=1638 RepID=UPI0035A16FAE
MVQSTSAKSVCYNNVLIESFFSHLKTEVFYSQDFTATNEQIIELVGKYIYYYNNERIQLKLNKLPPVSYREQFCTA